MPTTALSRTDGYLFTASSISAGAMFWPPRMISSFSRPVMVRKPLASLLARSPGRYHPSRMAAAVSAGLLWYPSITLGPRTISSPSAPNGASFPLAGSMIRTARPGTGKPHDPGTRPPTGQFIVPMVDVSVMPYPSSASTEKNSSNSLLSVAGMIAPAETHKRTLGSFDADVSAERENIERDLDLLA